MQDDFSDAALMLIGHGSTVNAESAAATRQQAEALRQRKIFREVREAFWKQEPFIAPTLGDLPAGRVFCVPYFISEGYFTGEVIPRALGFPAQTPVHPPLIRLDGARMIFYCGPVGTHDSMTDVLLARARDIVEKFPFPRAPKPRETTLFIAGHGTERNENSRKSIERQVELIRAMGIYAGVHAVFIEEKPSIADCYTLAQTKNIVIVPFFISDGMHTDEDIPVFLGEAKRIVEERLQSGQPTWRNPTEKQGKRVWYTRSIGTEPLMQEVILQRVREAAIQNK